MRADAGASTSIKTLILIDFLSLSSFLTAITSGFQFND